MSLIEIALVSEARREVDVARYHVPPEAFRAEGAPVG